VQQRLTSLDTFYRPGCELAPIKAHGHIWLAGVVHETSCRIHRQGNPVCGVCVLLRDDSQAVDVDLKQGCQYGAS